MTVWLVPLFAQVATATASSTTESPSAEAAAAVSLLDRAGELLEPSRLLEPGGRLAIAYFLAVIGLWLLLPTGRADWRRTGSLFCVVAGCFFASLFQPLGDLLTTCTFSILASITVVSAVSTIVAKNPVYSAIWFAVTLLGTGGLFLLNGAHFLGVATVAVYAGAIVVTFLFVLMLAQPEGHAFYDRVSWGATPAAMAVAAGLLIVAATTWNVQAFAADSLAAGQLNDDNVADHATDNGESPDATAKVLNEQHVAAFGGNLFTEHLIAVQAAGVLLFAALVGAVAIAGRDQLIGRQVGSAVKRTDGKRRRTNTGGSMNA